MTKDRFEKLQDMLDTEFEETLDDLIEVEFNEPILSEEVRAIQEAASRGSDGRIYYPNLLRLQSEMIKLQDWVVATNAKVLILCEGRDSAGKGGVIKRITQRLDPRVARVRRCRSRRTGKCRNGISSVTCRIFPQAVKWCFSTGPGTTVPGSSVSWGSPPKTRSNSFSRM